MNLINYISNIAVPATILIIVVYGLIEKQQVFDVFLEGSKEGLQIVVNIFPTLLGLFLSINVLRASGILDAIANIAMPLLNFLKIPLVFKTNGIFCVDIYHKIWYNTSIKRMVFI